MRKLALLSLLLVGCGGGGSSVSDTFDIVGRWKTVSISDDTGTTSCPGDLPSGRDCADNEGYEFRADSTYYNFQGGGGQFYEIFPSAIFMNHQAYTYTHTVNTLTINFPNHVEVFRKE